MKIKRVLNVKACDALSVKQAKDKINQIDRLVDELIAVGEDYEVFQSAQFTHKTLKAIKALLRKI